MYTRVAFILYRKFYEIAFRQLQPRTYEDFVNSDYFSNFSKFGSYIADINAINPEAFVTFLLKAEIPMKNWQLPIVYDQYIRELNKKETASAAVERNILLMQQWEMDTGEPWHDFFKSVNTNLATKWIRNGRMSPWVLYNASTSIELLSRFTDEQLSMIEKNVDPAFWQRKFDEQQDDVVFVKELLSEAGL